MSGLSLDPLKRSRQLANLRQGGAPPAPEGNQRRVTHGAYAAVTADRLEAKALEVFDALAADAPLRDAGDELPAADAPLVRLAAEALCRLDGVSAWLAQHGWIDGKKKPRTGVLDLEPHEVTDLVAHVQPGDYQQIDAAMYLTAAHTGLRLSELRALRWHAVDMAQGVVRVERGWTRGEESSPKSRKRRSVPLSPAAAMALADLRDASKWSGDDDRVFAHPHTGEPLPGTPLGERFAAARDAAGVPPITFHGLRHTFGTTLARAGWPVGDIQALMGHADIATTQIYMHYAPRHDQGERIAAAFATGDPRHQALGLPPAASGVSLGQLGGMG